MSSNIYFILVSW